MDVFSNENNVDYIEEMIASHKTQVSKLINKVQVLRGENHLQEVLNLCLY